MPKSGKYSKSRKSKLKKSKSKKPIRNSLKKICRSKLSNKIKINMREMKSGNKRIKSQLQAIAIAYSQIRKKYPKCSKVLKK
jgi:hypothetical protein